MFRGFSMGSEIERNKIRPCTLFIGYAIICSYNDKIELSFNKKEYGSTCFFLQWKYNIRFMQHEMLNMLLLTTNLDVVVRYAAKKLFS